MIMKESRWKLKLEHDRIGYNTYVINKLLSKDEINRYAVDLNSVKKYPSFYDGNALLGCAYEEDSHTLLLIKWNESTGEIISGIAYSKGKIS